MATTIKRVHYFDHQFLHADDFVTEQEYHKEMRRRHNRLLHTWGIAHGYDLEVERNPPQGATGINISAGTAYDREGREIVLTQAMYLELKDQPESAPIYVTICYQELEIDPTDEAGVQGNTRWSETPLIEPLVKNPNESGDKGLKLILARVERQGAAITNVDLSERRYAGMVVRNLTLSNEEVESDDWPTLHCEVPGRVDVSGDLRVTGNMQIEGNGGDACYIDYPKSLEFKRSGQTQMTIDRHGGTHMGLVFATGIRIRSEKTDWSPVIIANFEDDENAADRFLNTSQEVTVIISGPLTKQVGNQKRSYLKFYWKDKEGKTFKAGVQGEILGG